MFEKVWALSDDLRTAVTVWRVGERRYIKPHDPKPPKIIKVVGKKVLLNYVGSDIDCDIYEGEVPGKLEEDRDLPQEVIDYLNYYNKITLILAKLEKEVNEIIQESRKLSETPEDKEESDGATGSSESGD